MTSSRDERRIRNEVEHGKYCVSHGPGETWNWESPAGKVRWARRVGMLTGVLKPGMKVLELGCGTGYFTREIAKCDVEITAIDISEDLLNIARKEINSPKVRFMAEDACHTSFSDQYFDCVLGSSVLHHLEIESSIREIYRVLRKGGPMCFTEPNMLNPQIALQKNVPFIKKALGDSPDETAFFRNILQRKLKVAGFHDVRITPFDFLHPSIPVPLIRFVSGMGQFLEDVPLIKEIAGSLYIRAVR